MTDKGHWRDAQHWTKLSSNQQPRRVTAVLVDDKPAAYEVMPDGTISILEPLKPSSHAR